MATLSQDNKNEEDPNTPDNSRRMSDIIDWEGIVDHAMAKDLNTPKFNSREEKEFIWNQREQLRESCEKTLIPLIEEKIRREYEGKSSESNKRHISELAHIRNLIMRENINTGRQGRTRLCHTHIFYYI